MKKPKMDWGEVPKSRRRGHYEARPRRDVILEVFIVDGPYTTCPTCGAESLVDSSHPWSWSVRDRVSDHSGDRGFLRANGRGITWTAAVVAAEAAYKEAFE